MITINQTKLDELLATYDAPGPVEADVWDAGAEALDTIVQDTLNGNVFVLPVGAEAIAYFLDGDDPGFIFAMRPHVDNPFGVNVSTPFISANEIEPTDPEGKRIFDGAKLSYADIVGDLVESIRLELDVLRPAYEKLWGE